jgi:xanthine dehydrogenase YagS FAD-binding subunit
MRPFDHHNANSLDQALDLLSAYQGKARLIAGGTDLLGVLKDEILDEAPKALINIKTISGLAGIDENRDGLTIGALTKLSELERSALIQQKYPLLASAAHAVASPEIRNMGTVGGNLCQDTRCWYYRYPHSMGGRLQCLRKGKGTCLAVKGDNRYHSIFGGKKCFAVCPSDMAVTLMALEASLDIANPRGGRTLAVEQLYAPTGTTLGPDEVVTRIQVPGASRNWKQAFIKFRVRESVDFAIASVACALDIHEGVCQAARIVMGAVAPTPLRATGAESVLVGKTISPETAVVAGDTAVASAKPLRRNEFKVHLVRTLVARTLLQAVNDNT